MLRLLTLLAFPLLSLSSQADQMPIFPNINDATAEAPLIHPKPTLTDLLTIESSASIFYSYARELELSARFADARDRLTVFAPTNKAVMALARKPHQGPAGSPDDGITISEEEFDSMSKQNVDNWVSAHILPESPISFDVRQHPTLLHRKSITFTPISKDEGKGAPWSQVTLEDGVRIIGMKEASNGVLYMIDGSISYD
ncbi:hypothetical protein C0993_000536 [Termitomyces sp. T159_Od127]|nr:hypothetical protein C0993_000536 [Termitomyces sp. T159_Od127]